MFLPLISPSWVVALNYFFKSVISPLVCVMYRLSLICKAFCLLPGEGKQLCHIVTVLEDGRSHWLWWWGVREGFICSPPFFLVTVLLTWFFPSIFFTPHILLWTSNLSWFSPLRNQLASKHLFLSKQHKINEWGTPEALGKGKKRCILYLFCILLSYCSVPLPVV